MILNNNLSSGANPIKHFTAVIDRFLELARVQALALQAISD
jgi:hypothetical protein